MKNKMWTEEEITLAVKLIKDKNTYNYISEKLGRTKKGVIVKLQKLGYSIREERFINKECLHCGEFIKVSVHDKHGKKFCNNSCATSYNNRIRLKNKEKKYCLFCENEIKGRSKKYCSIDCANKDKRKKIFNKIENGDTSLNESNYRNYLIKKYGAKCMECGWSEINPYSGKVPVQLEHIDGNPDNNSLENLKLLCPNHHSLTPTFGALNKGNGRHSKRKTIRRGRYKEGKST